ncbi:HlyD family efflux transporter periplasmic adaptor subunit [Nodularia spumigena CS-586/05]|uniref:DevB-like secretion protein n=1 Tax=Nodularia spumigena CENA596 TaxID=1819295 RepID=A0A166JT14_NODSP|nr:HlyD family efflux transporter periplasmic adaptor subunit [Nodularia spumigena]KZL50091.1 DevB-like secretion protein [Nodularia spumigena CENA596]MDB9348515.1 HlyD family efflux transporter periplasmic adaptor subunit [Nodularia spumigena CS-588/01]MDB9350599.1 HlyD family efflux transporter periplasmic adaptor subunit [Nodularia spumigena CS-588/05]MDB9367692.1 HlyD family efflux transporter periplasmic adaptor subunit [Nodularia spumigena CS-586/05]MDB9499297.1 HlyD family efflux transp
MKKWQITTIIWGILNLTSGCTTSQANINLNSQIAVEPAPVTAVVALGQIEPEGEVIRLSVPNAQDSRVNQILVKEGDFVQRNQIIAILQGIDQLEADLKDAETDVSLQQAELLKVQQGEAKKAEIAAQTATINRLKAQLKAETIQKQAAINIADATLEEAQLTYQRRQDLSTQGAISIADADTAKRELATAEATLMERTAELDKTITTLQAQILEEEARLTQLTEIRPVDIEIANLRLQKAKIAVIQRKARLENAKVRAPAFGQILRINTRIGEQVNTSRGIVEIARTDRMFAVAEVAETDIDKIRLGQQATISSEYGGFSGDIKGNVEQIALQIGKRTLQDAANTRGPTTDDNSRVIAVKIRIDPQYNSQIAALTYMLVRVKIDINQ